MKLIINTDGGSRGNPGPAAVGIVISSETEEVAEIKKTIGTATNNEAEYQAVLEALAWLKTSSLVPDVDDITWKLDSKLVVEQLSKNWKIKEPRMRNLAEKCWQELNHLAVSYTFLHVPRAENKAADALVNQALDAVAE